MAKHQFQTEVNQLLHLMIHSLYSNKEIFLRELVSNASDALDKLNYLKLTDDQFKDLKFDPRIEISFDDNAKTLTIKDSGIGMNENDLIEHLGTIAKSGTKSFVENLTGDAKKDSNLIGQFGVGFYASYMVADKVEVISRKAGEAKAYKWVSEGKGEYDVTEAERDEQGTTIILHLNDEGKEYAGRWSVKTVIEKYSNHIPYPIFMDYKEKEYEEGKEKGEVEKRDQINSAKALWKVSKSDLKDDDYNDFYKTISHDSEDPMLHIHTQAEGTLEYTTLFYIPKKAPFDLYRVDYQPGVKLYVKRVFITDDEKELLPTYLRFVRGIIDSEDLPLNVSREILQQNRVLANIKSASVKKILSEFKKLAKESDKYAEFIEQYGRPLKEGLYQDHMNRDELMELVRFKSNKVEGWTSFAEYKSRMKEDQKAIYYITGENEANLRNSPLLEAYKDKDIEVLIMADDIDEIIIPSVTEYKETPLKSVNRTDTADDLKSEKDEEAAKAVEPVLKKMKEILGEEVKEVKASVRLSDSPSCLVADENDPTAHMAQMFKAMGQEMPKITPILEINPKHPIVAKLNDMKDDALFEDVTHLLFEQAMLLDGSELKNPSGFAKRLNAILEKAL